jgi:hypothetical protein
LDVRAGELFSYVDLEERVPQNHPLRVILTCLRIFGPRIT